MRATVGIDVGTSAVKVIALAGDGRTVLGETSRPYGTSTPRPGWVEQSPLDWWNATCLALADLGRAVPGLEVAGVGVSGQVNGLVLLDPAGEIVGDAIIWLDTRAAPQADRLMREFGAVLTERASTEVTAISVLAKLAWLAENDPGRLAAAATLLFVKDYIVWRLTGRKVTDASDATSASLMDVSTLNWLEGAAAIAGFDPRLLPPIVPAMAPCGTVTSAAAAQTGLPEGTPVVPGAGDVAALAVGCGVIEPGVLGITLGTAGHVVLSRRAADPFPLGQGLWRVAHAEPGLAVWLGLVMSGGLSLSWMHGTLRSAGSPLSFPEMVELAAEVPPGANGVSFVPFLEGAATPYGQPNARGGFAGLSSSTRAGDMVRAVMEGVAFNVRQCVDLFVEHGGEIGEIRLAEGGARVDLWCRILADALGRPVTRLGFLNTSSLGAALMAHAGITGESLTALCGDLASGGTRFHPEAEAARRLDEAYARYLRAARAEIARSAGAS